MMKIILRCLRHPLFITIVAGVMTCFWGQHVAYQYQIRQLRYQQEFEIFKERFSGSMELLDEISLTASERLMGMERVLWVIKDTSKGNVDEVWDDYYKTVLNWNVKQLVFKTKLIQFVGDRKLIVDLMDNEDSSSVLCENKNPKTLHGHFIRAHKTIKQLYQCAHYKLSSESINALIDSTQKEIIELGQAVEEFHNKYLQSVYRMGGVNPINMFHKEKKAQQLLKYDKL